MCCGRLAMTFPHSALSRTGFFHQMYKNPMQSSFSSKPCEAGVTHCLAHELCLLHCCASPSCHLCSELGHANNTLHWEPLLHIYDYHSLLTTKKYASGQHWTPHALMSGAKVSQEHRLRTSCCAHGKVSVRVWCRSTRGASSACSCASLAFNSGT